MIPPNNFLNHIPLRITSKGKCEEKKITIRTGGYDAG
jgi:hypothetical protein